jgi:hypothetical protein
MWSRKISRRFDEFFARIIKGNCKEIGEYATFQSVEPNECSSSQTRRPTNWATPGYLHGSLYTMHDENANRIFRNLGLLQFCGSPTQKNIKHIDVIRR